MAFLKPGFPQRLLATELAGLLQFGSCNSKTMLSILASIEDAAEYDSRLMTSRQMLPFSNTFGWNTFDSKLNVGISNGYPFYEWEVEEELTGIVIRSTKVSPWYGVSSGHLIWTRQSWMFPFTNSTL